MAENYEEEVRKASLTFVDFFDAVIIGIVLLQVFEKILIPDLPLLDKVNRLALTSGVFYLLMWDWLHTRLLTLKNPLYRYRRFFMDVISSFFGYGAALRAVNAKLSLLVYIALILILGAWWANCALFENPQSEDRKELEYTQILQLFAAIVLLYSFIFESYVRKKEVISIGWSAFWLFMGWVFVFAYELFLTRSQGVMGGPGIPFLNRKQVAFLKSFFSIRP